MPDELWQQWHDGIAPAYELERDTELYGDLFLALKVFGIPYPRFMNQTTAVERHLYRMFLALEAAKMEHAQQKQRDLADAQRRSVNPGGRTRP